MTGIISGPGPTWRRWLPARRPGAPGRPRLFCFPPAGAGSAAFHAWTAALPALDVCALEYPGRWTRLTEQPFTDVPLLVKTIADDINDLLQGRYAFFGHSYGAVVAFELAREVRRRGLAMTEHLFVGAARAPQLPPRPNPIRSLPDGQLIAELGRRYGALPKMILDPEVLNMVVPIIRADITAFETYTFRDEPPLPCPITALCGRDDPAVDDRALDAWRHQTAGRFCSHVLAGDHFFMNRSNAETFRIVRQELIPAS